MQSARNKVAVLIPYFQREPGILKGTVQAVLAQKGFDDYEIVIADDGSPVPAQDELADLIDGTQRIRIVRQANAGPGAARNTALSNMPPDATYVALLDSDDQLNDTYLADAVDALNQGYDLFFGNSQRGDMEESRFDWKSNANAVLNTSDHRLIDPERELYAFQGDFFDFIVFRSNIIGPSTMMYRRAVAPQIRYNEAIYNGQDRIFKLQLCQHMQRVVFSPRIYASEGRGINIFDSAAWGSERSLSLASSYIEMCKVILQQIPLQPRQRAHVKQQLNNNRYNFALGLLHHLRQGSKTNWKGVIATFRSDPISLMALLPNAAKALLTKTQANDKSAL